MFKTCLYDLLVEEREAVTNYNYCKEMLHEYDVKLRNSDDPEDRNYFESRSKEYFAEEKEWEGKALKARERIKDYLVESLF